MEDPNPNQNPNLNERFGERQRRGETQRGASFIVQPMRLRRRHQPMLPPASVGQYSLAPDISINDSDDYIGPPNHASSSPNILIGVLDSVQSFWGESYYSVSEDEYSDEYDEYELGEVSSDDEDVIEMITIDYHPERLLQDANQVVKTLRTKSEATYSRNLRYLVNTFGALGMAGSTIVLLLFFTGELVKIVEENASSDDNFVSINIRTNQVATGAALADILIAVGLLTFYVGLKFPRFKHDVSKLRNLDLYTKKIKSTSTPEYLVITPTDDLVDMWLAEHQPIADKCNDEQKYFHGLPLLLLNMMERDTALLLNLPVRSFRRFANNDDSELETGYEVDSRNRSLARSSELPSVSDVDDRYSVRSTASMPSISEVHSRNSWRNLRGSAESLPDFSEISNQVAVSTTSMPEESFITQEEFARDVQPSRRPLHPMLTRAASQHDSMLLSSQRLGIAGPSHSQSAEPLPQLPSQVSVELPDAQLLLESDEERSEIVNSSPMEEVSLIEEHDLPSTEHCVDAYYTKHSDSVFLHMISYIAGCLMQKNCNGAQVDKFTYVLTEILQDDYFRIENPPAYNRDNQDYVNWRNSMSAKSLQLTILLTQALHPQMLFLHDRVRLEDYQQISKMRNIVRAAFNKLSEHDQNTLIFHLMSTFGEDKYGRYVAVSLLPLIKNEMWIPDQGMQFIRSYSKQFNGHPLLPDHFAWLLEKKYIDPKYLMNNDSEAAAGILIGLLNSTGPEHEREMHRNMARVMYWNPEVNSESRQDVFERMRQVSPDIAMGLIAHNHDTNEQKKELYEWMENAAFNGEQLITFTKIFADFPVEHWADAMQALVRVLSILALEMQQMQEEGDCRNVKQIVSLFYAQMIALNPEAASRGRAVNIELPTFSENNFIFTLVTVFLMAAEDKASMPQLINVVKAAVDELERGYDGLGLDLTEFQNKLHIIIPRVSEQLYVYREADDLRDCFDVVVDTGIHDYRHGAENFIGKYNLYLGVMLPLIAKADPAIVFAKMRELLGQIDDGENSEACQLIIAQTMTFFMEFLPLFVVQYQTSRSKLFFHKEQLTQEAKAFCNDFANFCGMRFRGENVGLKAISDQALSGVPMLVEWVREYLNDRNDVEGEYIDQMLNRVKGLYLFAFLLKRGLYDDKNHYDARDILPRTQEFERVLDDLGIETGNYDQVADSYEMMRQQLHLIGLTSTRVLDQLVIYRLQQIYSTQDLPGYLQRIPVVGIAPANGDGYDSYFDDDSDIESQQGRENQPLLLQGTTRGGRNNGYGGAAT